MNKTLQREFEDLRKKITQTLLKKAETPIDFSEGWNTDAIQDEWFDLPQQGYVDKYEYYVTYYIYAIEHDKDGIIYFVGRDLASDDEFHFRIFELDIETILSIVNYYD